STDPGGATLFMNFQHVVPAVRELTLKAWQEKGKGKKTIVFCAGVEHAHRMAEDISRLGVKAVAIDGKTQDRKCLLNDFKKGHLEVITNYGVLTEGFDDPTVECILMARPTTSPLVYNQCIGRGLRIAPQKSACVVIDIVDRNTHQLQYGASEFAGLPKNWRSNGRDPFRENRALQKVRVTSPEAFLRIQQAQSLEEVQSVLMSLPPEVIEAGLDGEPAGVERDPLADQPQRLTNNECYEYLRWHLERVSKRSVSYQKPRRRKVNPRALLRSMVPDTSFLRDFRFDEKSNRVSVQITGLSPMEMEQIAADFAAESGLQLDIRGQLSFFDEVFDIA
ncbi:MAG: helicase-related protein, partial [Exilibacterium sp.]